MTELLNLVQQAHGGIERWRSFDTVRATFSSSGGLLPLKGLDVTPQPTEGVATIHEETLRIDGYRRGATQSQGVLRRPHADDGLGHHASGVFQWLRALDLPDDAVLHGDAGFRGD